MAPWSGDKGNGSRDGAAQHRGRPPRRSILNSPLQPQAGRREGREGRGRRHVFKWREQPAPVEALVQVHSRFAEVKYGCVAAEPGFAGVKCGCAE